MRNERPQEPLSWEEWFEEQHRFLNRFDVLFPCTGCNGRGTIYDPKTKSCPIEGNKLRPRIECPKCQGTRRGHQSDWEEIYKTHVAIRNAEIAEWDRDRKIYDDLELTEDQKKAIRRFM